MAFSPRIEYARQLDERDPLAAFRDRFLIANPGMLYMDGNSLGRLPVQTVERIRTVVEHEWGHKLTESWGEKWWDAPVRVGEKLASLVGAASGQVVACDTVSINLFKLAAAALAFQPKRTRIVTDALNFPSDLYILQGLARTLGSRHTILRVGSPDNDISPDLAALEAAIDGHTALVTLSHVLFKSGYLYDMAAITDLAHRRGALVLWDLSHSVGAVPIELDACGADMAVGCTYKYLNGGPGAQAFLYVRRDLQESLLSPINGWWGQKTPFAFDLDYQPAPGMARFLTGSQAILSLLAMEASIDVTREAGMDAIRAKSVHMTEYLTGLYDAILSPLGFTFGSPRDPDRRGSHISIRHPEGYRINRALIEMMNVVPDFREPDNIRLGLAPLYTTFSEIWETVERIRRTVEEKHYLKYPPERKTVT
ncbi:MAG TPA: kynureninase [Anaerolineales bacterium]|nr:kynureninase [Anaerolineales bacterium]